MQVALRPRPAGAYDDCRGLRDTRKTPMQYRRHRWAALVIVSAGLLPAGACAVMQTVLEIINAALTITDALA